MQNMVRNMQKNSAMFRFCIFCILQYAQYAEYANNMQKNMSSCLVWVDALMWSQQKAKLFPSAGSQAHAQSSSLITEHQHDASGWNDCSGTSALTSRPMLRPMFFFSLTHTQNKNMQNTSNMQNMQNMHNIHAELAVQERIHFSVSLGNQFGKDLL